MQFELWNTMMLFVLVFDVKNVLKLPLQYRKLWLTDYGKMQKPITLPFLKISDWNFPKAMQMLHTKANKVHSGRWLLPKTLMNVINHIGHSYDVLLAGCLFPLLNLIRLHSVKTTYIYWSPESIPTSQSTIDNQQLQSTRASSTPQHKQLPGAIRRTALLSRSWLVSCRTARTSAARRPPGRPDRGRPGGDLASLELQ